MFRDYRWSDFSSVSSPKIHEPNFLSLNHWPYKGLPKDLFACFVSIQLSKYPRHNIQLGGFWDNIPVFTETFSKFWTHAKKIYPEKIKCLESSMEDVESSMEGSESSMEDVEFSMEGLKYDDLKWTTEEYYKYLYEDEFNKMTETERQALQDEFNKIRFEAYQVALKGEAIRLNCDVSEVRPLCPVLPLDSNGDRESRLTDLPTSLFLKIMNRLETIDVFRVTLVCKKWKKEIYHNSKDLKRAEHAKTTHLITFTDWMDPEKTEAPIHFQQKYLEFSLKLVGWCCRLTDHLETVIIPGTTDFLSIKLLLQLCPNLKNVQIGYGTHCSCINYCEPYGIEMQVPSLEYYYSNQRSGDHMSSVNTEILVSCESLLYFGAPLELSHIPDLDTQNRMHHAFENLIALDLQRYNVHVLEILANIDDLKLKYLRFGEREFIDSTHKDLLEEARSMDLLDKIVGKLKMLEILVARTNPGVCNSTIKVLTQAKLNLKVGSFHEYDKMYEIRAMTFEWDPDVLVDFGEMLLSNDPKLDLTQFCFIVMDENRLQKLKELNIGFMFQGGRGLSCCSHAYDIGLNDPFVKRRLGINF